MVRVDEHLVELHETDVSDLADRTDVSPTNSAPALPPSARPSPSEDLPPVKPAAPQATRSPWIVPAVIYRSLRDLVLETADSSPDIVAIEMKPGGARVVGSIAVDGAIGPSEVIERLREFSAAVSSAYIEEKAPAMLADVRKEPDFERWAHNFTPEAVKEFADQIIDIPDKVYDDITNIVMESSVTTGSSNEEASQVNAVTSLNSDAIERQAAREIEARDEIALATSGIARALQEVSVAQRKVIEQVGLARRLGATWQDVGAAVGTTAQAAHQRWDAKVKALTDVDTGDSE